MVVSKEQKNKFINWFEERLGKVKYSMDLDKRQGPDYYDCSSAVFNALIAAGILDEGHIIGSTEDLFALDGIIFEEIDFSELQSGDIFVAGEKGNSLGSNGHTGVYYSDDIIIHCNYKDNGISITEIEGRAGGPPVYWYRFK